MKMKHLIIIGIIIVSVFLFFFLKKEKNITNINKVYFTYSTGNYMNASVSYEDAREYVVDKKILKEIEIILKQYHVAIWDNFHKYDKNVLDGNSFSFRVCFENNQEIEANGYMKWPKNYQEVKKELNEIFSNYMRDDE